MATPEATTSFLKNTTASTLMLATTVTQREATPTLESTATLALSPTSTLEPLAAVTTLSVPTSSPFIMNQADSSISDTGDSSTLLEAFGGSGWMGPICYMLLIYSLASFFLLASLCLSGHLDRRLNIHTTNRAQRRARLRRHSQRAIQYWPARIRAEEEASAAAAAMAGRDSIETRLGDPETENLERLQREWAESGVPIAFHDLEAQRWAYANLALVRPGYESPQRSLRRPPQSTHNSDEEFVTRLERAGLL